MNHIFSDLIKKLYTLIQAEYSSDYIPNQLKNKRKKKREKRFLDDFIRVNLIVISIKTVYFVCNSDH